MYIDNISSFLPAYSNYERNELLSIFRFANTKGFVTMKMEKDFLLTLILIKFWEKYEDLIFKWGTCLNKVYFPYFRLSEDLDFVINHEKGSTARKTLLRRYEKNFIEDLEVLWLQLQSKRKADEYRLAMFTFSYTSIIDESLQTIKIDISLKNNLLLPSIKGLIRSTFKDPFLEEPLFEKHYIQCIDLQEAMAEKLRASLTRGTPAIRDFFDIWYVKKHSDFDFTSTEFRELLEIKLAQANHKYTLRENYDLLVQQIETDLRPVLMKDYSFDFDSIFQFVLNYTEK